MTSLSTAELIENIDQAKVQLDDLWNEARSEGSAAQFNDRLDRWKRRWKRWIETNISVEDADKFDGVDLRSFFVGGTPEWHEEENDYRGFSDYLAALRTDVEQFPETSSSVTEQQVQMRPAAFGQRSSKSVFIVHGHEDVATLELERELRETYGLIPLILRYKPGKGRTLIEKFEQEAEPARFGLIIMTPDDQVVPDNDDDEEKEPYRQSRPNVFFELGWFCGRIGRQNTCILFKKGTKIHSDFDGVNRHEFTKSVKEVFSEVRKELVAAGYDESKKEFDR